MNSKSPEAFGTAKNCKCKESQFPNEVKMADTRSFLAFEEKALIEIIYMAASLTHNEKVFRAYAEHWQELGTWIFDNPVKLATYLRPDMQNSQLKSQDLRIGLALEWLAFVPHFIV